MINVIKMIIVSYLVYSVLDQGLDLGPVHVRAQDLVAVRDEHVAAPDHAIQ